MMGRPWTKRGKEIKRIQELLKDPTSQPYPVKMKPPLLDPSEPPPDLVGRLDFGSTDRTCVQYSKTLTVEPCCDQDVVCVEEPGDPNRDGAYIMSKSLWESMGSPLEVIVAVVPAE